MLLLIASNEGFHIGDLEIARVVADAIEILAVIAIAVGVVAALVAAARQWIRTSADDAFSVFKRNISRGLLTGLDLLIAGDVIKTVTLEPTLQNATVLGILVLIRTFLSWALVLEVEGHWPWQAQRLDNPAL